MPRTYVVLEDRESLEWVKRDFGLVQWMPSRASPADARYGTAVDLLKALAPERLLPEVVFLDDVVPRGTGEDRIMDAYAAAVASAIRHLACVRGGPQPRIVVITSTAIDGQDLLAMLELGADDVIAKSDLASSETREAYRRQLEVAIDPRLPPVHATNAMRMPARWWPPRSAWPDDVDPRIRPGLMEALPLLPLWEAGIVDEELVNRHLRVPEHEILPDMRGINRHYVRRVETQAKRPGWLPPKIRDRRTPLRGVVAEGAREDGLLWVREKTRNRARALPWDDILAGCGPNVTKPVGHAPLASTTHSRIRVELYPMPGDPRRGDGGDCIYRLRRT